MIEHSMDDPFGKFAAGVFLALQQVEAVMSQHRGKWGGTALIWDSILEPTLPTQLISWMVARGRNLSPEMRALRNNLERLT